MANPQPDQFTKISNELLEALAKIRISGEARQMFDVIIRKTYGYQKKEDRISTSQFMQFTGLTRLSIYRARKKLLKMNLITIYKNVDSQNLTYSFQKDYDKWVPVYKKVDCLQKCNKLSTKMIQNCLQKSGTQKIKDNKNNTFNTLKDKDKDNAKVEHEKVSKMIHETVLDMNKKEK